MRAGILGRILQPLYNSYVILSYDNRLTQLVDTQGFILKSLLVFLIVQHIYLTDSVNGYSWEDYIYSLPMRYTKIKSQLGIGFFFISFTDFTHL